MSLKDIMNADGVIGHKAGSVITGGSFNIITTALSPSPKIKACGRGVYHSSILFSFSGGSAPGFVSGSVAGGGSIPPSAVKAKAHGGPVMRVGDSVLMNCVGTVDPPVTPPTAPIAGMVEVISAGQDKVKGQ